MSIVPPVRLFRGVALGAISWLVAPALASRAEVRVTVDVLPFPEWQGDDRSVSGWGGVRKGRQDWPGVEPSSFTLHKPMLGVVQQIVNMG